MRSGNANRVFIGVTILLFTAGWAANHFASVLVLIREQLDVSSVLVNGAFGIYALGLLPSLLAGGVLADRFGARMVVLTGGVLSALGNLSLLAFHDGPSLLVGRFIVGLGVGLVVSAGTAWAGRLRGASGVTLAGIILTAGFMMGPIVTSGLGMASTSIITPFAISVALSLIAVVVGFALGDARSTPSALGAYSGIKHERSMKKALAVSLPMAIWVFSCITTSLIVMSARIDATFGNAILLPGIGAAIAFSAGLIAQFLGRKFAWGRGSGIVGALCALAGFALAAFGGDSIPVWLFVIASILLGTAYGLCLREGLLGIETYTPLNRRGTGIGIYYVFTYLGFGLPVLLDALLPHAGASIPLYALAALALGSAIIRGVQIKRGYVV
ncbi:MFS transporter permease [[Brevibacterium] flavum]|uniref:MFS transporter permease n=1 Tax=[Brevibacterium] flavum TaxID=92706 RepID=A0A0F6WPI0_9CORY|nr:MULTISPECIES: MFS transporter [Corynebacterium]AKF26161.1 MFS transporter permease [[Brevibacterium] flavum]AST19395.1 MFS transporter [Corynebacterium glutamicum ATCC 14067]KEI21838.1 MFS transporter permease [Corynebacterium glutamicum ATCC 14067]QJS17363.1 MFS transporter [Corynebacterium glutamicum]QXU45880.1 MFS transporter [[Brevibacterium] flavum]